MTSRQEEGSLSDTIKAALLPIFFAIGIGVISTYTGYLLSKAETNLKVQLLQTQLVGATTSLERQQQQINSLFMKNQELESEIKSSSGILKELSENLRKFTDATNNLSVVVGRMDERLKSVENEIKK